MLACLQFNSAEFSDKEEIIAPVITVWERFSVAKNQQMSKHPDPYNPSLVPFMLSTESLVVSSLRDFTHVIIKYMSVLGPCKEIFSKYERKEQLLSLLLYFSGSLSLQSLFSVSFTSSPLSVSPQWGKEAHHSLICLTDQVYIGGVCLCVYVHI